jgi:hypothetical protein
MSDWLPWSVLGFILLLIAAMPWQRPHPNHEFMFRMWASLEDASFKEDSDDSGFPR